MPIDGFNPQVNQAPNLATDFKIKDAMQGAMNSVAESFSKAVKGLLTNQNINNAALAMTSSVKGSGALLAQGLGQALAKSPGEAKCMERCFNLNVASHLKNSIGVLTGAASKAKAEAKAEADKSEKIGHLVSELNIGSKEDLEKSLSEKEINKANNLRSSVISANTKIFGGCGPEKNHGGFGDRGTAKEPADAEAEIKGLADDLAGQGGNVKLAIFKSVKEGQAGDAAPLKEFQSAFNELSTLYQSMATKEGYANLTIENKQQNLAELTALTSKFAQLEGQLDNSPLNDLSDLKMTCISLEGSASLLAKSLKAALEKEI